MSSVINTNISSLTAQRNLAMSQASLSTSMQRLSSGLRINSAKDDAAGLAISERMTAQIRGSNQAARNANDGISLAQTAEGDLGQIGSNLQRMRELAVQSANATNSSSDRAALDGEVQALAQEIDRVAQNSSFNGTKLLDGSFASKAFQVGANNTGNDSINIAQVNSARTSSLGNGYAVSATTAAAGNGTALAATDLTINGIAVGASLASYDTLSTAGNAGSAIAKAAAINAASAGVTATAGPTTKAGSAITASSAVADGAIKINGVSIGALAGNASITTAGDDLVTAINAKTAQTGVTATNAAGTVTLAAADGRNIDITANAAATTGTGFSTSTTSGKLTITGNSATTSAGAKTFVLADGGSTAGAANSGFTMGTVSAVTTSGTKLNLINVLDVAGAKKAIDAIDLALTSVNSSRAELGAYQNRFTSVVTSLQTTSENLSASRSRIQDADFAAETANLSRSQILQQAGTAMVAQANQLPQGVLQLLK
jgi:flagellin